jgi:hypothetical protein
VASHIKGRTLNTESTVLRRIFGPQREEVIATGETCIMRSFIICTCYLQNAVLVTNERG